LIVFIALIFLNAKENANKDGEKKQQRMQVAYWLQKRKIKKISLPDTLHFQFFETGRR